jgi:hypothetical protein
MHVDLLDHRSRHCGVALATDCGVDSQTHMAEANNESSNTTLKYPVDLLDKSSAEDQCTSHALSLGCNLNKCKRNK